MQIYLIIYFIWLAFSPGTDCFLDPKIIRLPWLKLNIVNYQLPRQFIFNSNSIIILPVFSLANVSCQIHNWHVVSKGSSVNDNHSPNPYMLDTKLQFFPVFLLLYYFSVWDRSSRLYIVSCWGWSIYWYQSWFREYWLWWSWIDGFYWWSRNRSG